MNILGTLERKANNVAGVSLGVQYIEGGGEGGIGLRGRERVRGRGRERGKERGKREGEKRGEREGRVVIRDDQFRGLCTVYTCKFKGQTFTLLTVQVYL